MAIAPADFGKYAGDLLAGSFGDGAIIAFDLPDHGTRGPASRVHATARRARLTRDQFAPAL